ncbi:pyridoxamine 5'-phosphate oxidase family protein [Streptomyces canus]|uniref:pyridoxamine 5'-phosphate oxidase family protein n=1 Tax=Streptomyces canus TaxID=58343 RepID=UPI003693C573
MQHSGVAGCRLARRTRHTQVRRQATTLSTSTQDGLAKTHNLRRGPRAALEVTSEDGRAWATAEGVVTLHGPGTAPDDPAVEAPVTYYRTAAGEHPDRDAYRQVMVADRRVLIELHIAISTATRSHEPRSSAQPPTPD